MPRRRLIVILTVTLWAMAALVSLSCTCCVSMGSSCPGVCAASPSVVVDRVVSRPLPVARLVLSALPCLLPPCTPVPTPPPRALALSLV